MDYFILQLQLKFMTENTSEDDLLREGDISVEDNLEGMATGSKSSTVLSENAELKALLTSMNETMKAMSESLRGSGEKPPTKPADSAKRGRNTNNGSHDSLSDSAESDADHLLESNKRQKIQDGDEEEDTLLDEIVRSMNETEKTDAKISEKLAKIVENRWLNKLSDGQLKEKTEKYLRLANCDNFITPKVNPEIWETFSYRHFSQLPLKWDTFAQKLPNFCCKPEGKTSLSTLSS